VNEQALLTLDENGPWKWDEKRVEIKAKNVSYFL